MKNYDNQKYVSASTLRAEVDITACTLRLWANKDEIDHIRLPKGRRLYNREHALQLLGITANKERATQKRSNVIYARVSSAHQKADLQTQIEMLQKAYPGYEVIQDVASGLNWKRKGFKALLDRVYNGDIATIVVAYKDRLARFGCELLEWIFEKHHTQLVVHDTLSQNTDGYNELAEDLFAVTNFFVARHNGARKNKRKIKKTKDDDRSDSEEADLGDAQDSIET